jgi:hypothetical protein
MKHNSYQNRMLVEREWNKIAENRGETNEEFLKFYYIIIHLDNPVTLKKMRNN